jgi:hypothetical protein
LSERRVRLASETLLLAARKTKGGSGKRELRVPAIGGWQDENGFKKLFKSSAKKSGESGNASAGTYFRR